VALAEERQGQYAELLQFVAAYEPGISMPNFLSLRELLTGAYIGNLTFVLVSVHTMYILLLVSLPPCNLTHRWINMIDGSVFFIAFQFCSRLY